MKRIFNWLFRWRSRITTSPTQPDAVLLCRFGQGDYTTLVYGENVND